jgi:solute carrier family 35 protein F1/2
MAAILYGLGDTVAEYYIKHVDRYEYLGLLGVFGWILTAFGCLAFEQQDIRDVVTNLSLYVSLILAIYVASVLLYYVAEASFLTRSDATLLNLSLQGSNLWAVSFSTIAYRESPPLIFYLAALLVLVGVLFYGGQSNASYEDGIDASIPLVEPRHSHPVYVSFEASDESTEDSSINSSE